MVWHHWGEGSRKGKIEERQGKKGKILEVGSKKGKIEEGESQKWKIEEGEQEGENKWGVHKKGPPPNLPAVPQPPTPLI